MKTLFILLICGTLFGDTWTRVTTETSSTKPFRNLKYAFNALITTNGTQGIANSIKPFSDAKYAINIIIATNEEGKCAMITRLADGGISLTNKLDDIYLQSADKVEVAGDRGYPYCTDSSGSNITIISTLRLATSAITADYTVTSNNYFLACSGTLTNTLPSAPDNPGQIFVIKNTGTGIVYIYSSDGIDTVAYQTLPSQFDSVNLISDGTSWNKY